MRNHFCIFNYVHFKCIHLIHLIYLIFTFIIIIDITMLNLIIYLGGKS